MRTAIHRAHPAAIRQAGLTALLAVAAAVSTASLAAGVGTGPCGASGPGTVVSSCTESALDSAVAAGGAVTFSCSGTITLTNPLPIAGGENLSIDGGNQVTISGDDLVQIAKVSGGNVTFANIALVDGLVQGITGGGGNDGANGPAGKGGVGGASATVVGQDGSPGGAGTDGTAGKPGFSGLNATEPKGGPWPSPPGAR